MDPNGSNAENFPMFFKPNEDKSKKVCTKCNSNLVIARKPKRILHIDCENFAQIFVSEDEKIYDHNKARFETAFDKITQTFEYGRKNFDLKAVIERLEISGGHFIVHIKRNNNTWETFDDTRNTLSKPPQNMFPVQLVYVMKEDEFEDNTYGNNYIDQMNFRNVDSSIVSIISNESMKSKKGDTSNE